MTGFSTVRGDAPLIAAGVVRTAILLIGNAIAIAVSIRTIRCAIAVAISSIVTIRPGNLVCNAG
jgi:hypothetical protein